MMSLFRARRPAAEDGGSGGKIVRGRRAPPRASPYARPPASSSSAGSPRWFLGIVSGARKIISSVFRSDGVGVHSSASSSSGNSSGEDSRSRSEEQEGVDMAKELQGFDQGLEKKESITECMEESHTIVSKSENILTIEKLFKQETFSRDECNKLIRLIESRAVESPSGFVQDGMGREIMNKGISNSVGFLGDWKHNPELPKSIQYSTSNQWYFSPRTPAFRACSPDNHSTAVMEAKKWIEEKRQSSDSKAFPVSGPCTLSNDMPQHGTHDIAVSPVDLAKSYMRSLPPWQSSHFGSSGLVIPVSTRLDFGMDEKKHATTSLSLPPFKDFKRNYLSSLSRESPVNSRHVRQKLAEDMLESRRFREIGVLGKLFENESSKFLSAVNERSENDFETKHNSCSPKDTLKLPNEKAVQVSPIMLADKSTSIILTSEPKETVEVVKPAKESGLAAISLSDPTHSKIESELTKEIVELVESAKESALATISLSELTHSTLPRASNEQLPHVMNSSPMEQEDKADCKFPCEPFISASTLVDHAGDYISEKAVVLPECNKCSILSDVDDVNSLGKNVGTSKLNIDSGDVYNVDNDFQTGTSPVIMVIPVISSSAEVNLEPDAKLEDINVYKQDEISGLAKEFTTNGSDVHDVTHLANDIQTSNANINANDVTNLENDFHSYIPVVGIPDINSLAELNLDPDAKLEGGNAHPEEANGLTNEISTNGGSQSHANSQSLLEEEQSDIHMSNSEQTVAISTESCGLPSENVIDTLDAVPVTESSSGKFENGIEIKSVEQVLIELQPIAESLKKRAVAKRRRGRGRGRSHG